MTSQKSMRKEKIIMKKLKKLNYATDGCTLETFGCYCSCSCWWFGTVNSSNDNANSNEYSCAMKSHFRKFGNQMSGSGNHLCNYASLLA